MENHLQVERADISFELKKKLKANLQKHSMENEEKRMVWCAITWLFVGNRKREEI